jgi:acyl-CoA dehydrogenase
VTLGFSLSSDIDSVTEGLAAFIQAEVVSRHEEAGPALSDPRAVYLPDGTYAPGVVEAIRDVRMTSSKAGYYTMFVPESIGGAGLGSEALYRVWEDVFHRFGPHYWLAPWTVAHWVKGPSHVLVDATEATKARVLPDLLSGRTSLCFGMSEPNAGSDARMMRTRAQRKGDGWVISGSKIWITNGPYAEHAVVFAVSDPDAQAARRGGISAFLVPTDAPGFSVDASIRMFGSLGGDEALLYLDDVVVDEEALLGEEGKGFAIAMSGVSSGRLYNAARAVGLARWALERGVDYAERRESFGKPISAHQGVAFPLAESAMEIHAAHLMGLNCALLLDQGRPALKELSMAKAFSTEAATRAIDRVTQVHGAMGFTNEMGFVEAWQSVRKACVADGTAEILRRAIARELAKGDLDL